MMMICIFLCGLWVGYSGRGELAYERARMEWNTKAWLLLSLANGSSYTRGSEHETLCAKKRQAGHLVLIQLPL
ncbi:hypothetical protein BDY19DRAFT_937917 [Irpex rosettiformis]|uniref:Uncharacterized protein n=1 Tax=Irpex rosettiformis TaxID=378272 RepID=A0ACB8U968_9APHY|nr:hypothetical protein BDY19DRAFT_937917 [Irpex rosettiformis]